MSYILDALRRADSERERGVVPSLHTQPVLPLSVDGHRHRLGRARPWGWVAAGASILLVIAAAWWMGGRGELQSTALPEVPAVTPPPTVVPDAAVPQPIAPPAAEPTPAAAHPPSLTPTVPEPRPLPMQAAPPLGQRPQTPSPAKAETPPTRSAAARIYAPSELPDDIRRSLPALEIGGSIYSKTPADRFLIIGGQIFHEGDKLSPDLTLEEIKLKAAVLQYKGYRYAITF